jgi:hypothetical protein
MITRIIVAFCVAVLFCLNILSAQPVGTLPTYYNGGFAGEAGATRVASYNGLSHYSDEIGRSVATGSYISVDHFLKKLRSGMGISAMHAGNSRKVGSISSVNLAISPKFSFKGKYTFSPFADFGYGKYNYKNTFTTHTDSGYVTKVYARYDYNSFQIRTGFLLNSAKAYFGITVGLLDYATVGYPAFAKRFRFLTNMNYALQAGYTFQRTPESDFSFTPQLLFSYGRFRFENSQTHLKEVYNSFALTDLNLTFRYKKIIWGLNNDGLMVGLQTNRFKLQINNFYFRKTLFKQSFHLSENANLNIFSSSLRPDTYMGSISLRYIFKKTASLKMPGFQN